MRYNPTKYVENHLEAAIWRVGMNNYADEWTRVQQAIHLFSYTDIIQYYDSPISDADVEFIRANFPRTFLVRSLDS